MSAADQSGIPMPEPPRGVQRVERLTDLRTARQLVVNVATACGLGAQRCADLAVAVSEVVTNAIRHGGGSATIFAYDGQGVVSVEVHDRAVTEIPTVPAEPPSAMTLGGRGLWLARRLCDRMEIRRHRTGNIVRLVMNLAWQVTCARVLAIGC